MSKPTRSSGGRLSKESLGRGNNRSEKEQPLRKETTAQQAKQPPATAKKHAPQRKKTRT